MWPQIVLISHRDADLKFAQQMATVGGFALKQVGGREAARRILVTHPLSVVLWDAELPGDYEHIGDILPKYVAATRLIALTDGPLVNYTHLLRAPIFGHHVIRRFTRSAPALLARIAHASLKDEPGSLIEFFPKGSSPVKLPLKRAAQKRAAIEALQTHLTKRGIRGRLAALIAQSTDELLMNAIFDAPYDNSGIPYRHSLPRDMDFEFEPSESLSMELCSTPGYSGVAVTDSFGTLRRGILLQALYGSAIEAATSQIAGDRSLVTGGDGSGLGLRRTFQSGFSLLFRVTPKKETQAILFYPEVDNFRDFKEGFQFLSLFLS